jgi:AcrR family transcriptional regulator
VAVGADRRLTRDRILQAAVEMADRDGFDAVTLRRLAAELNVHVTSLYNHVETRDAVTDGIAEVLIEEAKLPTAPVNWESWVRTFVAALRIVASTHPGAFTALQRRPIQGPRAAKSFEVALAAFVQGGWSLADAYQAIKATTFTALSLGLEEAAIRNDDMAQTSIDELPVDDFPLLSALPEVVDPEPTWEFALETLVAGLRAQRRRRRSDQR